MDLYTIPVDILGAASSATISLDLTAAVVVLMIDLIAAAVAVDLQLDLVVHLSLPFLGLPFPFFPFLFVGTSFCAFPSFLRLLFFFALQVLMDVHLMRNFVVIVEEFVIVEYFGMVEKMVEYFVV